MKKHLFRGKPKVRSDELGGLETTPREYIQDVAPGARYEDGYIYGQVVYSKRYAWIVGKILDWDQEYLVHEWWIPVDPETVEVVE